MLKNSTTNYYKNFDDKIDMEKFIKEKYYISIFSRTDYIDIYGYPHFTVQCVQFNFHTGLPGLCKRGTGIF
jgi:hypothetical protein